AISQVWRHLVVEDRLAVRIGHEGGPEARPGVQLRLAVAARFVQVEEDHERVIESFAADAPLVDQGCRVARRGILGVALRLYLGIDDELRRAALLDAGDDRLGARPNSWAQHPRRVVDRLPGDR